MARLQGASGIHVGTMGYGKMEGEADDKIIAYMIDARTAPKARSTIRNGSA